MAARPRIVDRYMDGKINIDNLITHVMRRGESIRSVVVY